MKDFWNQRYAEKDYAYGQAPNTFFKEKLRLIEPGKLHLKGEVY